MNDPKAAAAYHPQQPGEPMSTHTITTTEYHTGVRVTCTCGWMDRWNVKDGSAQQSAAAHLYHQESK